LTDYSFSQALKLTAAAFNSFLPLLPPIIFINPSSELFFFGAGDVQCTQETRNDNLNIFRAGSFVQVKGGTALRNFICQL
jgi:hypothetical protein